MSDWLSPSFIYSIVKDLWNKYLYKKTKPFVYKVDEEIVTFDEKMRSLKMDVIKVMAHDHELGIAAEYAWMNNFYPKHRRIVKMLSTLEVMTGKRKSGEIIRPGETLFDIFLLKLDGGREKSVYFDISNFFSGEDSSLTNPSVYANKKLADLYSSKS
ncbi:MAG: hypothetical protein AAB513_02575 [Patescibacteria group bacterium]